MGGSSAAGPAAVTVTVQVTVRPLDVCAVMVAEPAVLAVTVPFASTSAISVDHLKIKKILSAAISGKEDDISAAVTAADK